MSCRLARAARPMPRERQQGLLSSASRELEPSGRTSVSSHGMCGVEDALANAIFVHLYAGRPAGSGLTCTSPAGAGPRFVLVDGVDAAKGPPTVTHLRV